MVVVCTLRGAAHVDAQTPDLRLATLEELMKIEVTSASRREQPAEDVPAAVYVIGHDEIRRSGLTSIPELLRLAPGVHVAQINANKWAVSVRGFNGLYSNKLLVLVDGRSIYNPAFATVLWDTEDFLLEDIDRIEVIRGPGGAMWGADAVNGIINIITKSSSSTPGGFVQIGGGTLDAASAAVRYAGTFGGLHYRAFAQGSRHGDGIPQAGAVPASDRWHSVTSGIRADWSQGPNALMLQSSSTHGQQRPLWFNLDPAGIAAGQLGTSDISTTHVAHVLGRWTHTRPSGESLQVQAYYDQGHREETIGVYQRSSWDIDAQYHVTVGARHDLVAGGGYRLIEESRRRTSPPSGAHVEGIGQHSCRTRVLPTRREPSKRWPPKGAWMSSTAPGRTYRNKRQCCFRHRRPGHSHRRRTRASPNRRRRPRDRRCRLGECVGMGIRRGRRS